MRAGRVRLGVVLGVSALLLAVATGCGAARPAGVGGSTEEVAADSMFVGEGVGAQPETNADAPDTPGETIPDSFASAGAPSARNPGLSASLSAPPPSPEGRAIVVDQSLQMMGIFEDGVEVRRMPVSTGRPTYSTYTLPWNGYVGDYWGTFQSYTGGMADNAWFLYQATGAILIHGAPYNEEDGLREYYDLDALGNYPSSAGCIRLHPDDARWLTEWGPLNVPITVTEWPGPIEGLLAFGGGVARP